MGKADVRVASAFLFIFVVVKENMIMFGRNEQRQIDLHLPTSWNRCTTEELEAIAAAIIQEQRRVDRYHPFDWQRVKLNVVLAVNGLSPDPDSLSPGPDSLSPVPSPKGEGRWLVRRPQDSEPWPITTGQLVALTERLAWIDDEKADKTVFQFPYPELEVQGVQEFKGLRYKVQGPPPLLDGYTWREYRWLTDWMQEYMRLNNAKRDASAAQREFLAVLFKAGDGCDTAVNATLFADFSPIKWQVILFWWSSLMSMLAKKFPKVFKSQPVGKHRRTQKADTPWDFYNRVTATIQKYIGGLSEQDVNNATYGTILQQLEMMADEAAEMEKLKKK